MYFNPRSPHGERHLLTEYNTVTGLISIHAPRTGSDNKRYRFGSIWRISIHAPRTEGATYSFLRCSCHLLDFNPRSPHGERHWLPCTPEQGKDISIHAPRTGSDVRFPSEVSAPGISIHAPARGATASPWTSPVGAMISIHAPRTGSDRFTFYYMILINISIHAPRTGSDMRQVQTQIITSNFNPRSPHGGADAL